MHIEKSESSQLHAIKRIAPSIPSATDGQTCFDTDFIERLLGRRQGGGLTRSTKLRLQRVRGNIHHCIEPKVTHKVYPIKNIKKGVVTLSCGLQFESRKMAQTLEGASWLVCYVSTIGPKIDLRINSLMQRGRMADAYVADTIGSGAIEYIAENFHNEFEKKLEVLGQSVSLRFSPGYCDWQVTEQHKLFSLLDNDSVGVELGSTFLMAPRKSISAIFGVFDKKNTVSEKTQHNPCRSCWKKDCIARRIEVVPPQH